METINDINVLWDAVLEDISPKISQITFDLWIKNLTPVKTDGSKMYLHTLLESTKAAINKSYINIITDTVKKYNQFINQVIIICDSDNLSLSDSAPKVEIAEPVVKQNFSSTIFNQDYTFDNFVVGGSNQIAVAAAKSVADNPGKQINPLFIYGGVGLGKTHIMHAIGNHILSRSPSTRILYVTTAQFINEYIDSIVKTKDNDLNKQFREKYRNVDVLMLDDIQFLNGKVSTQEALFHTFNDLFQSNRQIIFTSDCHPKDLNLLEERLRSRFNSGLTIDINPPDLETRIAILQRKAYQKKYQVSIDVINYIAEKIDTNIRELEGALSKVMFLSSLNNQPATIELVNTALKDEIDNKSGALTMDYILDKVCEYFKLDRAEVLSKKRNKQLTEARQIAIYIITDQMSVPQDSIGKFFNRDHTTIIHSRDKIADLILTKQNYKTFVDDILYSIKNR